MLGTATLTIYGWIAEWPSGVGPNNGSLAYGSGTWSIESVATEVGGTTATSSPVQITLVTLADLVTGPLSFPIQLGFCNGSLGGFGGTYLGSTSVGTVDLGVAGGEFTLTTDVGSVSGSAGIAGGMGYLWGLHVTRGTGSFRGRPVKGCPFFVNLGLNDSGPYTGSVGLF